jgi:hypothetical protein
MTGSLLLALQLKLSAPTALVAPLPAAFSFPGEPFPLRPCCWCAGAGPFRDEAFNSLQSAEPLEGPHHLVRNSASSRGHRGKRSVTKALVFSHLKLLNGSSDELKWTENEKYPMYGVRRFAA